MIKRLILLLAMLSPLAAHADPVTTAVAAFAAWAGTTAATVYLVAATVALSTGMAIYGSAQARRAEREARDARYAAMQDRMATRIAGDSPHRFIYGRAKVGADIVAMFTSGPKDEYKHIVCVMAAHECDAVEEVYVNNVAVGLLNASGDATTGRFAPIPGTEAYQESKTGPSFTLSKMPVGPVQAFTLSGIHMTEVAVTAQSGRNITVASSGTVIINYQYNLGRRFGESVDETVAVATSPYVRVQIHLGGATDPADDYLMSVVPDKWTSTAVLRGLCYLVVTLDLNNPEFQGGQVPIQALVRGRKLYDPRTGLTQWSANPALAIRDYLTSPLCGVPASDIPTAQIITAANVCDESEGGWILAKRYTINGSVTSAENQASVLEAMAQCMAGSIVSTTWEIQAGKYVAPVAALLESDIVGAISISPGASDATIYNGVKGQYLSDENGYVLTDFKPYQNAAYLEADGRDLYTNIDFPFTNTLQRVTNLARIFTEDHRNDFTIKAEFSLKAWPRKVGERITFTSAYWGQNARVFRITDKSFAPNSAVELTLKEDDASIWDFADAVTVDSTPNTDLPDPWAIAPLASISCTSGVSTLLTQPDGSIVPRILATWPVATTRSVFTNGEIEIEWRAISTETWQRTAVSGSATQAYLSPITPGFFYVVRARTVNPSLNVKSDWIMVTYQVQVFSARPVAYKWAATQPATPAGDGSYVWSTGLYGAAPAGWSLTQPAAPGGGGVSLWEVGVPIADISAGGSTAFDWSKGEMTALGYAPVPGNSNYTWVKYGTSSTGAGLTDDPTNMSYIGFAYNKTTATESTNAADYAWSKLTGSDGATIKGDPGVDGTTYYTWVKYSDNADGAGLYDTPTSTTLYLGLAVNKTSATESIVKTDYVWSKFKGDQGVPGTNNAIAYAYQRSASAPTGSPGAVTYDFSTNSITTATLANGWQKTIPAANGNPLYVTAASASAAGATDTIASGEWSGAVILAQDGTAGSNGSNGANGAAGLNSATITIYQRSATATAPALPSASTTYTFATGALTGLNNGWTQYIPAANGLPFLHASTATAAATTATDAIANTEWAAAQLQARDGADGNFGVNIIPYNSLPSSTSGFTAGASVSGFSWEGPFYEGPGNAPHGFDIYSPLRAGCVYVHAIGTPGGSTFIDIYKDVSNPYPVVAGRRYEFSVALRAIRCDSQVRVNWYSAAGAFIAEDAGAHVLSTGTATYIDADFTYSTLFATAPPGAAKVMIYARQQHNGSGDAYTFASQWYVGESGATQTVPSKWSDSPAGLAAAAAKAQADAVAAQAAADAANDAVVPLTATFTVNAGADYSASVPNGPRTFTTRTASVTGGSGSLTYKWSSVNGNVVANSSSASVTITGGDFDTVIDDVIYLTVTDSATGRTAVDTLNFHAVCGTPTP